MASKPPHSLHSLQLCRPGRREHFEVVRIVHDPQDVAERVDHSGGDEACLAVRRDRLVSVAPIDSSRSTVASRTSTCRCSTTRPGSVAAPAGAHPAVDPQLVQGVADPELDVSRASVGPRLGEVGLRAQELRVPGRGRVQPIISVGFARMLSCVSRVVGSSAFDDVPVLGAVKPGRGYLGLAALLTAPARRRIGPRWRNRKGREDLRVQAGLVSALVGVFSR